MTAVVVKWSKALKEDSSLNEEPTALNEEKSTSAPLNGN
jgi:hypothetical protein